MSIEQRIAQEIKSAGVTVAWICRKTEIPRGRLYPSLNGDRELRADEFLSICRLLRLDPRELMEEISA